MSKPVRVLVAEDNRDGGDLLMRELRKSHLDGHVKIVPDGKRAWSFLIGKGLNTNLIAIFLDLHLPALSGLKLLCRIKAHPQLRDVPVIVMMSPNASEALEDCSRLGADGFIAKPVTFTAFTKAVADIYQPPPERGAVGINCNATARPTLRRDSETGMASLEMKPFGCLVKKEFQGDQG